MKSVAGIELFIFDCDGVLVDSEPLSANAHKTVYARHGVAVDEALMQSCIGMKQKDIIARIKTATGFELPDSGILEIWREAERAIRAGLHPTPGFVDFIRKLETPRCVASSSAPERIHLSLETAGLMPFFNDDLIFSSSMVKHGKPAPDLFLFAASRCNAEPDTCVVAEDSTAGVQGAVAAGMRVIGYTGGSHSYPGHAERLQQAGAHVVCNSWTDITQYLAHDLEFGVKA